MTDVSLLDRAIYSYADVDRIVGLHAGTARRWLEGYRRRGQDYPPVLRPASTGGDSVTWGELVKSRLLAEFRGRKVSLQRLRPAVERLRAQFGPYPLARARTLLDVHGRELVLQVQEEVSLDRALVLVVVRNGQAVLDIPADRYTQAVTWEDDVAVALRPAAQTPLVRLDPEHAFGQPAIRGVRTEILAEDYRAGETRETLSDLYDLSLEQVDQALRYDMIATAAQAA